MRQRKVLTFVLDKGMDGLDQAKPMHKMGQHASPTGEIFLSDVRVGRDRLLGESEEVRGGGRQSAKDNFVTERAGVAAMSLGIIEECVRLSIDYARHRTLWGTPIGEYQLIQLKLAQMEVARINVRNLVFSHIERSKDGAVPTLAEASAMKLYSAQAACRWPTTRYKSLAATATSPNTGSSNSVAMLGSFVSTPAPMRCRSSPSPRI